MVAARPTVDEFARTHHAPRKRGAVRAARGRGPAGTRDPVIVVDASALIEMLLPTAAVETVPARFFDSGDLLAAPHLIDVEAGLDSSPLCTSRRDRRPARSGR